MAKKSTANTVVGSAGYVLGSNRSSEEWDKLFASKILPALRRGATMNSQRELYGPGEKMRMAARRAGYASIADAIADRKGTFVTIKVKGRKPQIVANEIAEARKGGESFNSLALRTAMPKAEILTLLRKHGYEALAEGRVIHSERGLARQAKAEAEAAAAARKPRARRTRKPKVEA